MHEDIELMSTLSVIATILCLPVPVKVLIKPLFTFYHINKVSGIMCVQESSESVGMNRK